MFASQKVGSRALPWILGLLLVGASGVALAQPGPADLALPEVDAGLVADDAPAADPDEAPATDPGEAPATDSKDVDLDEPGVPDAGPVDSGDLTAFDEVPDAGVLIPALPAPDALEQVGLPPRRTKTTASDEKLPFEVLGAPTPDVPTELELAGHIEARATALRAGDLQKADLELALLEELRLALAVRNIVVVSAQLIHEAKLAMVAGDLDLAVTRADAAARLSPDLEAAHWMRARLHWRRDKKGLPVIADALQNLVVASLATFRNQVSFLTLLLSIVGLSLLVTIALFAGLQVVKYIRYPAHDLAERVPDFIGGGELVILLLVLSLLPFGLGLGLGPSIALGLAVVAAYQQERERWVSWALMGVLAVGPLALYAAAPLVSFHGSVVDAMAEATSEAFAEQAELRLLRSAHGREDYASAMVLAHRMRQRGDVSAAEAAYRLAAKAKPNDPVVHNNLGVALLAQGKTEAAELVFRTAIAKGAGAEPYLNLSLIMAERGIFDQSTRMMESARVRNPHLVAQHTLMTGAASKKAAVAPFDEGLLWERLFSSGRLEADAVTVQLWRPMSGRLPPWASSVVVLLVTAIGAASLRRRRDLSVGCARCGLPAKRGAQGELCVQCTSVFLSSSAVQPNLQDKKERAVRNYQIRRRWTERLLAMVAGAGHIFGGRPVLGLVLLFPFSILSLGLLLGDQAAVHPWFVYVDESAYTVKTMATAVALGLLTLISLRSSFEK